MQLVEFMKIKQPTWQMRTLIHHGYVPSLWVFALFESLILYNKLHHWSFCLFFWLKFAFLLWLRGLQLIYNERKVIFALFFFLSCTRGRAYMRRKRACKSLPYRNLFQVVFKRRLVHWAFCLTKEKPKSKFFSV